MKYIFDFDDVIFQTTRRRKEFIYPFLEKLGISMNEIDEYYKKERGQNFSMKNLLKNFSLPEEEMYEKIMHNSEEFANKKLISVIKKLGKENCYIITYGDDEFQLDKIKRIGIEKLFSKIIVVSKDEKKKIIENICKKHKDEKVLFVDDKIKHFKNIDFKKHPNLKGILYDERGLEKIKAEIKNNF